MNNWFGHKTGGSKLSGTTGLILIVSNDNNGNRTSVQTSPCALSPAPCATTYTYDVRNRLETADAGDSKITTYTYYADGKKDTITYPNGTNVKYTYHPSNRTETIINKVTATSAVISQYSYMYDTNGNRTQQIEIQNGVTETTTYVYDDVDRLLSYLVKDVNDNALESAAYTYDGYNRKTEVVEEGGVLVKSRSYDYNQLNWLTKITDSTDPENIKTITYTYDNNGNTLSKSDSSLVNQDMVFTYDSRDQLTRTTRGPPGSETVLGEYDYNASGLRVRHRYSDRGDVDYYYDDNAVIEEHNASDDSLLAHYRYADRLISLDTGSSVQYYHHDALGSTVNLTDDAGSTQVSYKLDPWGQIREQQGTSVNRQIFTQQEHDENTGLIYFGARYYDPDTARFIAQDSYLGEESRPPSLHRYLYAASNPNSYIDVLGFDFVKVDKDKKVYWQVEKDKFINNPNIGDPIYIGMLDKDGKVYLTKEFGDGTVGLEELESAADDFWDRYILEPEPIDISGSGLKTQKKLIASYISDALITGDREKNWKNTSADLFLALPNWMQQKAIRHADRKAKGPERKLTVDLIHHYAGGSAKEFDLGQIPNDWQDWIVKATGGKPGTYKKLNPYNGGPFSLRNGLGHFDVTVSTKKVGNKTTIIYKITDTYSFPPDTRGNKKGQHGFNIGGFSEDTKKLVKSLMPTRAYWNPGDPKKGGYREKFEIKQSGKEQLLIVPQEFLKKLGAGFKVKGEFSR